MIISGGLVALPGLDEPVRADIAVEDGVITSITLAGHTPVPGDEHVVDATDLLVFPGVIDPHVHFDDPGYTEREDFAHGTAASASGGVTTIIDMASTSVPPVTSAENLKAKLAVVEPKAVIDFGFFGGVSGQVFESGVQRAMEGLAPDVMGFKCYFVSGMDTFRRLDYSQFQTVLSIARTLGRPVLVHAEDYNVVAGATEAVLAGGGTAPGDYYRSRPELAEVLAVQAAAELAATVYGGEPPAHPPVHIVHVSTGRGAEIIGATPFLSGETGPQYLAFTLDDFEQIGAALKVTPPPKTRQNRDVLWTALQNGALDFAASDHAPAPTEQKNTGSIWTDYAGIPGSGTLFPYLFSEGYLAGRFSLSRLLEITSGAAARRYGLDRRKGSIRIGLDGDLVLVDPDRKWKVRGEEFLSLGKVTPFEGMELTGTVEKTIVRGQIVYDREHGIVASPGTGQFLRRESGA